MLSFLMILSIVAAILLVIIILAQNPKGGGLSSAFGGSSTSNMFGVRQTNEFLEKATWYLAIGILVVVVGSNLFIPSEGTGQSNESKIQEQIDSELPAIPQGIPQQQGGQQGQQGQQGFPEQGQPAEGQQEPQQ